MEPCWPSCWPPTRTRCGWCSSTCPCPPPGRVGGPGRHAPAASKFWEMHDVFAVQQWTPTAITETATRVGLDMTRFQADLNTARRPACSSPRTGPTPGRRGQRHPVDLRQRPAGAGARRRPCRPWSTRPWPRDLTRCPQRPGRARTRVRRQPRRPAAVRRPQPQPADRGAGHRRGHQRRPRQRPCRSAAGRTRWNWPRPRSSRCTA